ncbi:MAG: rhombosortase, partial [Gammaproteobacteria bacterium]|nr:rhombosortase [Gammaproteobacteria bacterium]
MHFPKHYNYYYGAIVILVAIICTYYQELFLYQRHSLEHGELWRLFSGHFSHLNNKHL